MVKLILINLVLRSETCILKGIQKPRYTYDI